MVSLIPALVSAPKQSYLGEEELYSRDKNVPLSNLLPDCTTKCLVFIKPLDSGGRHPRENILELPWLTMEWSY